MKRILKFLYPFRRRMALGFTIKVLGTLAELLLPFILTHILRDVVVKESIFEILLYGGLMLLCAVCACLLNIIANRMAARVSASFSEDVRRELFSRTLRLSAAQIDAFTVPSLESRITSDTYNVHSFVGMMQRMGVRAPILLIGGIAITLVMDAGLSLIMIALLPFIFFIIYGIRILGVPMYTKVQGTSDGMIKIVREDTQGVRVIKALSKTERENQRFCSASETLSRTECRAATVMGTVQPMMTLLMNLGITTVVAFAAYRVRGGASDPETVIAFIQYFTLISMAMMTLSRIFVMYTKCAASAKRICEVLDAPEDMPLIKDETGYDTSLPHISFDSVTFSYGGCGNHLEDISFDIAKGGSLGIIGATASGKTTLIRLLLRFYDVNSGSVKIFGRDVRSIPKSELTAMTGIALGHDFIYSDTVEENIKFGRDLTKEQVENAARIAQGYDFISDFPEGFSHILTQKGTNISGGQKQRILIARAIAANPDILILDDASSALDYKTDAALRCALKESYGGTLITVAQRVSSVKDCDEIIVLGDGKIIGKGTHEELLDSCPEYREISNSQMGGAFVD